MLIMYAINYGLFTYWHTFSEPCKTEYTQVHLYQIIIIIIVVTVVSMGMMTVIIIVIIINTVFTYLMQSTKPYCMYRNMFQNYQTCRIIIQQTPHRSCGSQK
jgi:hypothetical protein